MMVKMDEYDGAGDGWYDGYSSIHQNTQQYIIFHINNDI